MVAGEGIDQTVGMRRKQEAALKGIARKRATGLPAISSVNIGCVSPSYISVNGLRRTMKRKLGIQERGGS